MSTIVVSGSTPAEVSVTIPQVNSISVTPPEVRSVSVSVVAAPGAPGQGLVSGGSENQFIQKNSATDYDTKWSAYTLPAADGAEGTVLTTDGAGTVSFAHPQTIAENVKNVSGGTLYKGTPVHVTGSVGNLAEVIAADAATNYPAHFVLNEDLDDDEEGLGIALGFINNVDVPDASIYTEGQTVYLGAAGGWVTSKPTGASNAIQNLGIIIKVNVTGGGPAGKISGIIMGAGRANDVPNIATGNIWAGNADGVATATDTAYIDIANRRVGIGTVTPTTPLHVVGNIRVNASTDHVYSNRFTAIANADVYLRSYNGYNLILNGDTGDNVGIGTTAPAQKLDVNGIALTKGVRAESTTDYSLITRDSGGNTVLYVQSANSNTNQPIAKFNYGSTTANSGTTVLTIGKDISYFNATNVGIGTTTPTDKLDVRGTAKITSPQANDWIVLAQNSAAGAPSGFWDSNGNVHLYLRDSSSNANVLIRPNGNSYFDGGNVGIGTTSPSELFQVNKENAEAVASIARGGTNLTTSTPIGKLSFDADYNGAVTNYGYISVGSNDVANVRGSMDFAVKSTTGGVLKGMTLYGTNSGVNVGVGTTSPSAKLDVVGFANINDGSNNVMISSGNTAMTGASNTTVGYQAGRNNTSGINNSFVGYQAGYGNTTGGYNSFVGRGVGQSNTSGSNNSFVGYQAGYSNTIGSDNSFVGLYAGFNNTIGDNNSFFGRNAGYHSTGSDNVVIGYGAGFGSATSTYSNTVAVGYQALYDLTSGAGNTAVGYQASTNIAAGNNNTSVGYQAGFAITSGSSNSFFGTYAGVSTTGSENTAVGHSASFSNTTGTNNVAIGRGAGYTNSTGSRNIFLGYQAGYYETGSDKLYINNSSGSNPLIYGDFNLRVATINGDLNVSSGNLRADAVEINGRALAATPAAGEYGAGSKIVTQFASGTVTAGKVYVANAGAWAEGDANAGSTSIGMIAVATDSASATEMLIEGVVKLSSNTGFSGAAEGTVLYLSTTAGELTTVAPSTAGEYVRVCGYVVNESTNEVFFSPSRDWTAL